MGRARAAADAAIPVFEGLRLSLAKTQSAPNIAHPLVAVAERERVDELRAQRLSPQGTLARNREKAEIPSILYICICVTLCYVKTPIGGPHLKDLVFCFPANLR